jgi:hypothetical protein
MRSLARTAILGLVLLLWRGVAVAADCPGNLAQNGGFEENWYAGSTVGTSLSSFISNRWLPWAVLGDPTQEEAGYNYEPEYKILQRSVLLDGWYRVYAGERAQAFFSMYSTHTAGFYQRVAVPRGGEVTFSIWVQIYTGQEDLMIDGRYPVSDLVQPMTEPTRSVKGPGDYRVYVGIDPYGNVPAAFGDPMPSGVIWSDPVLDIQTRASDGAGKPIDEWVQLSVTTRAQADYVTIYTKGHPDFRTKHNDSYWDEACLQSAALSAPTVAPTVIPQASVTPRPTAAIPPTAAPLPTVGPVSPTPAPLGVPVRTMLPPVTPLATSPRSAPLLAATATATVTATPPEIPTLRTATITLVPLATATPAPEVPAGRSRAGLALLYVLVVGSIGLVLWWIRVGQRSY